MGSDVLALCNVDKSTKVNSTAIGKKGIGFKSVFKGRREERKKERKKQRKIFFLTI